MLRFIGIANIAGWFGSVLFFTLVVGPGIFSPAMYQLFGWPGTGETARETAARYWAGSVAQVLLERYYRVHLICGVIAVAYLIGESILSGRPFRRVLFVLSLLLLGLGLAGGYALQPRMHQWHQVMYGIGGKVTVTQAAKARAAFKTWHAVAQTANLLMLVGLGCYLWQVSQPVAVPRFVSQTKFHLE